MRLMLFLTHYFAWHYTKSIVSFFAIWRNFLWFSYNLFSIPVLVRTLFSPFERLGEEYEKKFEIWAVFSTFLVNSIMRIVGAVARLIVVALGIASLACILAIGSALFVIWVILPLVAFMCAVLGIQGLAVSFT